MQQAELQLKAKDIELKEKKLQIDAADKADRLELERERIDTQKEIAGLQAGVKIATDKANLSAKEQMEGLRIGVDVAREQFQMQNQAPASPTQSPEERE
jgi:hypothetical protein